MFKRFNLILSTNLKRDKYQHIFSPFQTILQLICCSISKMSIEMCNFNVKFLDMLLRFQVADVVGNAVIVGLLDGIIELVEGNGA